MRVHGRNREYQIEVVCRQKRRREGKEEVVCMNAPSDDATMMMMLIFLLNECGESRMQEKPVATFPESWLYSISC
jgi:hypothetical protein